MTAADASTRLSSFLWLGVGLLVVGSLFVVLGWPGTEIDDGSCGLFSCQDDEVIETGSWGAVSIGFIAGGVGQMLVLISLVGYGVMLGNRASRD